MTLTPEQHKSAAALAQSVHDNLYKVLLSLPANSPVKDCLIPALADVMTINSILRGVAKCN